MNLNEIAEKHAAFVKERFPLATPNGSLNHLEREIKEVRAELEIGGLPQYLAEEYADCLLCLLSSMALAGVQLTDVCEAADAKIVVNRGREWKLNPDGCSYSHIKRQ